MSEYRERLEKLVQAAEKTVKRSRTLQKIDADEKRREREELAAAQESVQGDTEPSG